MLKRSREMYEEDDSTPASSSSSKPSNMILPERQCPGLEQPTRQEITDAVVDGNESECTSFIDEIALTEAFARERMHEGELRRSSKRLRDKTSQDAILPSRLAAHPVLLPAEELSMASVPSWKITKSARSRCC